jgi:hypothetical protein
LRRLLVRAATRDILALAILADTHVIAELATPVREFNPT